MNNMTKMLIEISFKELHETNQRQDEEIKKLKSENIELNKKIDSLIELNRLMDNTIDDIKSALDMKSEKIINSQSSLYRLYKNGGIEESEDRV